MNGQGCLNNERAPYDKKLIIKLLRVDDDKGNYNFILEHAERKYKKTPKKTIVAFLLFKKDLHGISVEDQDIKKLGLSMRQLTPYSRIIVIGQNYNYDQLGAEKLAEILINAGIPSVRSIKLWGCYLGWHNDLKKDLIQQKEIKFESVFLYRFASRMAEEFYDRNKIWLECRFEGYLTEVYISKSYHLTYVCGREQRKTTKEIPWAKLEIQTIKGSFQPIVKTSFDMLSREQMHSYFSSDGWK